MHYQKYLLAFILILAGFLSICAISQTALAQPPPGLEPTARAAGLPIPDSSASPITFTAKVINIILGFLGVLAVAIIIFAGFKWMTSAGNEQSIDEAKTLLRNGFIGLVIILSAYAVTAFVVKQLYKSSGSFFGNTDCSTQPPAANCENGVYQCVNGQWICPLIQT